MIIKNCKIEFSKRIIIILLLTSFYVSNAQSGPQTKLVKDLNNEERCAYKVLQKLILKDSKNPNNVQFFSKIRVWNNDKKIIIETNVFAQLTYFESDNHDSFMKCGVTLDKLYKITDTSIQKPLKTEDTVNIYSYISYKPEYKIGRKAKCSNFEWIISHDFFNYVSGKIYNTEYFIDNENNYEYVDYVDSNYAIVKKAEKFGVISRNNKVLLPIQYQYMVKNDFGLLVNDSGKYYFFNPVTGKKLSQVYSNASVYAMYKLSQKLFPVKRDGKATLLTSNFEELVPVIYDHFQIIGPSESKCLLGNRDNKYVLIDSKSGLEISKLCPSIKSIFNGDQLIFSENNLFGIMTKTGELVLEANYEAIITSTVYKNKSIYGLKRDSKFALYNYVSRTFITNFEYDDIFDLGYIIGVKQGNKFGAIDINGKIILPILYDSLRLNFNKSTEKSLRISGSKGDLKIEFDQDGKCIENCN